MENPDIRAIIPIWFKDGKTFFVQRSSKMENYPMVWTLPSIQFKQEELENPENLEDVQKIAEKMSIERFNGAKISIKKFLKTEISKTNPINKHIVLHLYLFEFLEEPKLNEDFYLGKNWLTFEDYEKKVVEEYKKGVSDVICGTCMRAWGDYAYLHGLSEHPFSPPIDSK